ncbi:MAG: NADH-quinone oxidoreductase subunit C [Fidelibacterota bacterium]
MAMIDTLSKIEKRFPESVLDVTEWAGEFILHIHGRAVRDVLEALKQEGFNFLVDLTAVDNLTLGAFQRFAVVYHLLSHQRAERCVVKAYVSEDKPSLPSVESLWKTADWQEREVYDLYGIDFEGHPNLIRILNPEEYEGHPLRKDYPREGRGERKEFQVVTRRIGRKSPRD